MKKIKVAILLLGAVVVLVAATRAYLGYHHYFEYEKARAKARSIEGSFEELEANLRRAVKYWKNPEFFKEMSRVYLEMAIAQNEFGTAEMRDHYLDLAWDSLIETIERNPIDAFAHFRMGKVYLLYNFPLVTYIDKVKLYFRKALELKPADEVLNHHVLYVFLTQWDFLTEEEREYVFDRLRCMTGNNERFIDGIRRRWKDASGNDDKLQEILQSMGVRS